MSKRTKKSAPPFSSPYFQLHRLAQGVYAAIALPGTGAMGNAGIIELGERCLIFDTFFTPPAAADLRRAAETLSDQPVRYVVNSHRHGDHVLGNQVFADATIIATATTRTLIETLTATFISNVRSAPGFPQYVAKHQKPESEPQRQMEQAAELGEIQALATALPTIKLRLPDLTFHERLNLYGSQRSAQLHALGGGHTASDVFLYLPEDRILFAGDLVQVRYHPMMSQGSPPEWRTILGQMKTYPATQVVPGHGEIGQQRDITIIDQYIEQLSQLAEQIHATQSTLEDVPIPAAYAAWHKADTFYENLRFLVDLLAAKTA